MSDSRHRLAEIPASSTKTKTSDRSVREIVLVLLLAVLPGLALFRTPIRGADEAQLLVYPEQLLAGRSIYVDFATVYGPLNPYLLRLAYSFSGPDLAIERAIALGWRVLLVLMIWQLLRRQLGSARAWVGATLSALMLALLPLYAAAWICALTLVLIGIVVLDRGSRAGGSWLMTALAGCSFGLAAGFRFEATIFVISAIPFLLGNRRQSKIVFSAGLGAGLLPTVMTLLVAGPLTVWEIVGARMGADASLPEVTKATWLFGAVALAGGLSFIVHAWRLRWMPWAVACALTSLLAFPQMVQRFDIDHVAYVGAFTAAGLAALPAPTRWTSPVIQRVLRRSLRTLPLAFAGTVFLLSLPLSAVRYEHGDRWLYLAPRDAESFALLTEELDRLKVPDGVALFVGAQDMSHPLAIPMWHYHLLPEYPTRARFLELFPNMTELADSGLDQDILNAELLLLFDLSHQEGKYTPNIPPGSQQANTAVERAFCRISTVGKIAIYRPVGTC